LVGHVALGRRGDGLGGPLADRTHALRLRGCSGIGQRIARAAVAVERGAHYTFGSNEPARVRTSL